MPNLTYPGPENIQRQTLPNGITILVYENFASESIVLSGLVRAGALAETHSQAGLASFTASLLLHGTRQRSFGDIYEALESVGAGLDFSSGRHTTEFSGHALAEDLPLLVDLLAQSLREPTFPVDQVELLRGQILTGLQMRANDTRHMANMAFRELLYPEHPYSLSTEGYPHTVSAILREDMVDFHKRYYGPQGMILGIVGAVKKADAIAQIERVLGDWQNPQQQALPPVADVPRPPAVVRRHVHMPDKNQADVLLGLPGPRRAAPDYLDAKMMNTILGVFGMMGRIGENVREKRGLAYYAYSHLQGGLGPSPWFASAGVAPQNVDEAVLAILDEIARMQNEPVSAEELADSQAYITGSMPVGLETNSGLVNVLTDMEFYGLGLKYLQQYPDMIWEITPERVQAAAQKYLSVAQIAVAVAGS